MTETQSAVLLYIRLVSYPIGIIGVLWLMMFRPDWKRRATSFIYVGWALLLASQFTVVVARVLAGDGITALASDAIVTPALVAFNVCLWAGIVWISRRWRHDPHTWV